jgi:hypothetical protein
MLATTFFFGEKFHPKNSFEFRKKKLSDFGGLQSTRVREIIKNH